MTPTAYLARRLFDGHRFHDDAALLAGPDGIVGITARADIPASIPRVDTGADLLAPGFVDLQVNGGGGALFNDMPTLEAIRTITSAHARFGTTALLVTLITDRNDIRDAAILAGHAAERERVPGFLGLHLEGPHLSIARKGAHDPDLIRPMTADDLATLVACRAGLSAMLTTIAPENVSADQVAALVAAGLKVSLGHTDCSFATASAYAHAGARLVTHLFNAMSPLGHREPGMVGGALNTGALWCGLIADGFHVDPATIAIALRAKAGPGRIFLVSDAMSTIGTDMLGFTLNGRQIHRRGGRLTLDDGTLAGADIDMAASVRFLVEKVGLELGETLRMASLYPAEAIGITGRKGSLGPGTDADFIALDDRLNVTATWIAGTQVFAR